jgi:hypothetical protein
MPCGFASPAPPILSSNPQPPNLALATSRFYGMLAMTGVGFLVNEASLGSSSTDRKYLAFTSRPSVEFLDEIPGSGRR